MLPHLLILSQPPGASPFPLLLQPEWFRPLQVRFLYPYFLFALPVLGSHSPLVPAPGFLLLPPFPPEQVSELW